MYTFVVVLNVIGNSKALVVNTFYQIIIFLQWKLYVD